MRNNHIPVIHCLLTAGCDINATDKVPAAQYSSETVDQTVCVCVCVSSRAAADQRSQTALHIAAEMAKIDVVEMLLKAEFDLTIQDKVRQSTI